MKYLLLLLLIQGCSYNVPHPTSMNFDAQSMEYVGPLSAGTAQGFALCLIPTSTWQDLPMAINAALKKIGADAVINTIVETERGSIFGIYCWQRVSLIGTAIRFKAFTRPSLGK